jgi:3-hydroxyisobutyrate dehydrogenase-like beta-hydroxyacid dehydrogenase
MEAKPFALGYVGVGLMGLPMVQRLIKLGWRVRAYDIVEERVARSGAQRCAHASEVTRGADVVLLNLPTNEAVIDAVFGERGLASTLRPPQLLVDFSTIPVEACRSHAANTTSKGRL